MGFANVVFTSPRPSPKERGKGVIAGN